VQTWKKIQEGKVGIGFNNIFNRIPSFVGADKAAALFANEEEFKKARKGVPQPRFQCTNYPPEGDIGPRRCFPVPWQ